MLLPESQRLLKANSVRELGARVAFNFDDLHVQGDDYLAQIRGQAAEILKSAQAEAVKIREQALREAKEAGRREGLADATHQIEARVTQLADQQLRKRVESAIPAVTAIAETLQREADHWRARWETVAVETAVAIAEKILYTTLERRPEVAIGMISEALRLAAGHSQLRVQLHPDDIAQLGAQAQDLVQSLSACAEAVIIPDATVGRGGCRIETRHGEIDAQVDTMLARITEELLT